MNDGDEVVAQEVAGSIGASLDALYDVELDAVFQFGSREMLLREVMALEPEDVIELNRRVSEPVDLVIGDRVVARGEVVVSGRGLALRVVEVATPKLRLESVRCLFQG
jgi:flagellar motor switch protein FliN/FliY